MAEVIKVKLKSIKVGFYFYKSIYKYKVISIEEGMITYETTWISDGFLKTDYNKIYYKILIHIINNNLERSDGRGLFRFTKLKQTT